MLITSVVCSCGSSTTFLLSWWLRCGWVVFGSVVVNNPSVKLLSVENITDKKLTLGFNTSMPEELGIYQLKDESLEEDGILEFGDTCSLVSEGSEEDYYDYRKRYFITPTSGV